MYVIYIHTHASIAKRALRTLENIFIVYMYSLYMCVCVCVYIYIYVYNFT